MNLDGTISHIQHDINIGVAFPTSETVTVRGSFSSLDAYDKEKDVLHPFHVFEKVQHRVPQINHVLQPLKQLQLTARKRVVCLAFKERGIFCIHIHRSSTASPILLLQ